MVCHVVARLSETLDDIVVVAAADQTLPALEARIVHDREPHLGPLAGLREGLEAIEYPHAFVTATDAPFLTSRFIQHLTSHEEPITLEIGGFVQTLCAVYPAKAGNVADQLLSQGKRRPLQLIDDMGFRRLQDGEVIDPEAIRGFNTPDAYLDAVREIEPDAKARVTLESGETRAAPVASVAEVLRAVDLDPEQVEVNRDQGPHFANLSAPVGADETLWVTKRT